MPLIIILGVLVGVIINLCADSLPLARRLRRPVCATCAAPRPAIAWSGLSAYVFRRHHCPQCGTRLSIRHLIVELVTPACFVLSWLQAETWLAALLSIAYSALLVLMAVIDIEHRLILHITSLPAILLALVGAFINPAFDSPKRALLGGSIGLVSALTLYFFGMFFAWLISKRRGQPLPGPAFGFGDVTLSTFLGLIVGAPEIIFALVIAILAGFVFAAAYLFLRGLIYKQHEAFTAFLPYGPFLILGGAAMLYFGPEFMAWYVHR